MDPESAFAARMRDVIRVWIQGIGPEVGFWSTWLQTKGLKWPEDYERRMLAEPDFLLEPLIDGFRPQRVLDVGSGPFSPVGNASSWGRIDLHACDPLAGFYEKLYEKHGVTPYVHTRFAFAESLTDRYERGSFDLVHMSNALDHSILPQAGLLSMLAVARPGGMVLLRHSENEAEYESHSGFHQWNITEEAGRTIAWREDERVDLSALAGEYAEATSWRSPDPYAESDVIYTRMLRNAKPLPATNPYKNTFDAVLLAELHRLNAGAAGGLSNTQAGSSPAR